MNTPTRSGSPFFREWAREAFGDERIYAGLIYPIAVCLMTVAVGGLYIRETKDHKIDTPIAPP